MKEFFCGFAVGFREFGHSFANAVNCALLFVVYVFGVGVTKVVARLFKRRFLDSNVNEDGASFWGALNFDSRSIQNFYRQF